MHWMPRKFPAARKDHLVVELVGDETVIFDEVTTDAHCLSPLAAVVFEHCDGRTSVAEMAAAASERLGEPVDEALVQNALAQLDERRLLDGSARNGISRRDVMRRGALVGAAAVAAPLISTIRATPAYAGPSATCGGFKDTSVLCCPCATGSGPAGGSSKDACCETPFTNQCVCVKAEGDGFKYCKPSGIGAQGDNFCMQADGRNRPCCVACAAVQTTCGERIVPGSGGGENGTPAWNGSGGANCKDETGWWFAPLGGTPGQCSNYP